MKFNNFEDFFYCFADFCFVERIRYYKKMLYNVLQTLNETSSYVFIFTVSLR